MIFQPKKLHRNNLFEMKNEASNRNGYFFRFSSINMDSNMSLAGNVRGNSEFSHCLQCRLYIPYRSLAEHMALKHKIVGNHMDFNGGIAERPEYKILRARCPKKDIKSDNSFFNESNTAESDSKEEALGSGLNILIDITNDAKSSSHQSDIFCAKNAFHRFSPKPKYGDQINASSQKRPIGRTRSEFRNCQPNGSKRNDSARRTSKGPQVLFTPEL